MSAENQGEHRPRPGIALLLLICMFIGLFFIFRAQFISFFLHVARVALFPLKYTVGAFGFDPGIVQVDGELTYLLDVLRGGQRAAVLKKVSVASLWRTSEIVGHYYRFILFPLMAFMVWRAMHHPIIKLRFKHNFETLLQYQSQYWKSIVPVVNRDLTNDTSPEWAPARRCVDLARENGLIHANRLKLGETWEFLEGQLGPKWRPAACQPHEKALFVIFSLRIKRNRKAAAAMLGAINETCRKRGVPDFSAAVKNFDKMVNDRKIRKEIRGFGYTRTVLFQMLVAARRFDGKLPTADFLWLRPLDRTLWYALDRAPVDYGRMQVAAFAEGISIVSQWQAESLANKIQYRRGSLVRKKAPEGDVEYRIELPYLVTAMVAFAIDCEDSGGIEFPSEIMAELERNSTNEKARFDVVRDRYILRGLEQFFSQRHDQAMALAKQRSEE